MRKAKTLDPMNTSNLPAYATIQELAAYYKIGMKAARAALKRGDVPSVRFGRRILIPRVALEEVFRASALQCLNAQRASQGKTAA